MRVSLTHLLLVLLAVSASSTSYGQTKQDIAKCSAISEGVARLACFDALAADLGVDAPKIEAKVGKGKWKIVVEKSPIDDSKNVYLVLSANDPIRGKYGKNPIPTLHFRCKENETEGYINFDVYLGTQSARITTRLDKDKAQTKSWSISTDYRAAFVPHAIPLLKTMVMKESMLVQVTPYGENTVMTTFDVRGLAEAIKPLREACNWR